MEQLNEGLLAEVLKECTDNPGYRACIVTKTLSECREFLNEMVLQSKDIQEWSNSNVTNDTIYFDNWSLIKVIPQYSDFRGYSFDRILCSPDVEIAKLPCEFAARRRDKFRTVSSKKHKAQDIESVDELDKFLTSFIINQ